MRYKVFSIPACGSERVENELNEFLAQHKIIQVDRQLVSDSGTSYWTLCVGYQLNKAGKTSGTATKKPRIDYQRGINGSAVCTFCVFKGVT